jgi:hypothetical protein
MAYSSQCFETLKMNDFSAQTSEFKGLPKKKNHLKNYTSFKWAYDIIA